VIEKVSRYHREHGERSFTAPHMIRWIEQAGGRVTNLRYAGFVPMFCPDGLARAMKRVEGIVESTPAVRVVACAVYAIAAVRR